MNSPHLSSRIKYFSISALGAVGMILASGAAVAQPPETITVEAPHALAHEQAGHTYTGVPLETVSISHQVGYSDLNLNKQSDVFVLRARVEDAAKEGCQELDRLYPAAMNVSVPSTQNCVHSAIDRATLEINAAIAATKT